MKKELLCKVCGEKLFKHHGKQLLTGGTTRFTWGKFKKHIDAQKKRCVGCNTPFKKEAEAICFTNWQVNELPDNWESTLLIEDRSVQL